VIANSTPASVSVCGPGVNRLGSNVIVSAPSPAAASLTGESVFAAWMASRSVTTPSAAMVSDRSVTVIAVSSRRSSKGSSRSPRPGR